MSKYHFIAIGGIGMSGLAKYLLEAGHQVSGSDINDSKYIRNLRELGAKVTIGHSEQNVPSDAIVVKSSAIRDNNPEVIKAKSLGLPIYHRSDLLKEISVESKEKGKCFIGFSGTHGKTTTSGLASFVLEKADLKPSYVDGGILPDFNTNAHNNNGKHFIAELDESDGTIVKYNPDILVINNLEEDHIDFYKNGISDIVKTFEEVISHSKKVIVNNDDSGVALLSGNFVTYGMKDADYLGKIVEPGIIDIKYKGNHLKTIRTQLVGVHNVYNVLAVVAALNEADVDLDKVALYFAEFTGMGRRFQKVCERNGVKIYDDYAHHPTEIKTTLKAAAENFGKENVIAVFQPHRYTRLKNLWDDFLKAFEDIEKVYVTDIYAASEDPIEGVSSLKFSCELSNCEYVSGNMEEVASKILPSLKQGDVVVGLGAGTITTLGKYLEKGL